ncbi:MAG TPA: hypothetical protein DDZ39_06800, partial [Flavobacteriaceae bacterium]|nr:hypothetical protein [Flavobacteriaceae bacterium]
MQRITDFNLKSPISLTFVFEHGYATYNGDILALEDEFLAMIIYGDDLFWRINSAVNGAWFQIKKYPLGKK